MKVIKLNNKQKELCLIYRKYKNKILTSIINFNSGVLNRFNKYLIKTIDSCIFAKEEKTKFLDMMVVDRKFYDRNHEFYMKDEYGIPTTEDFEDIKQKLDIDSENVYFSKRTDDILGYEKDVLFVDRYIPNFNNDDEHIYDIILQENCLICPDDFDKRQFLELLYGFDTIENEVNLIKERSEEY